MGSPRFFWAVTATLIPMLAPPALSAQTSSGNRSSDLGTNSSPLNKLIAPAPRKPARRTRFQASRKQETPSATNDWNPHYLNGKEYFVQGYYDKALLELEQNLADCDQIDFDSLRRQNDYFEHIWNNIPSMGQNPHAFIRASNQQWVAAVLAAQGKYGPAETRLTEMENYAQKCFPDRMSTFEGCACQGLAFLMAARGQYNEAANRYRLALAHIEQNQAQIGLPPAPCVAMILVALADVELARGRAAAAEQCIRRAGHVQEAQRQLGLGPAPLDRAALLTVFAHVRESEERQSEAYDLYADALEIVRDVRKDHPLTAYCLDGLADIDLARGRLDQSEGHFRESLAVRKANLGENHREVAYSLDGLARVMTAQGKHEDAESFSSKAALILTRELGPAHPDVTEIAERGKRGAVKSRPKDKPSHPRARFLTIPTLVTVGWQVLHLGRDWRVAEANIVWREVKEAKTVHRASAATGTAASARTGQ